MKKILLILGVIILLVATPLTVFYLGQQQDLRSKAAPASRLYFSPETTSKAVGDEFSLSVMIDTGSNQVKIVRVYIQYDATKLQALSITNGSSFPLITSAGTVDTPGTASITVSVGQTTTPLTGSGTVAILRLKALVGSSGGTALTFTSNTFVQGINDDSVNVLSSSTPATVTISGASPVTTSAPTSAVPTATPTPIPTTSLTATPTPTGTTTHALSITSPTSGGILSTTPTFQGTASPSATVTFVINSSTTFTTTLTADTNGQWTYKDSSPFVSGSYSLLVSQPNPTTGVVDTATVNFTVQEGAMGGGSEEPLTGNAMPTSGNSETTLVLIGLSLFLVFGGTFVPKIRRR